jgi:hypothetical protein
MRDLEFNEDVFFKNFTSMSKTNFYTLLGIVEPMITTQNTTPIAHVTVFDTVQHIYGVRYNMRHFRQTHASYLCAKRKQKRTNVDIANAQRLRLKKCLYSDPHRHVTGVTTLRVRISSHSECTVTHAYCNCRKVTQSACNRAHVLRQHPSCTLHSDFSLILYYYCYSCFVVVITAAAASAVIVTVLQPNKKFHLNLATKRVHLWSSCFNTRTNTEYLYADLSHTECNRDTIK